jgi:hypothetical protein
LGIPYTTACLYSLRSAFQNTSKLIDGYSLWNMPGSLPVAQGPIKEKTTGRKRCDKRMIAPCANMTVSLAVAQRL